ncbi:MAG: BamA/TamA family outer membrane protein [Bacteroidota bacterium]
MGFKRLFGFLLIYLLVLSCSSVKYLNENQLLLKKNKINGNKAVSAAKLQNYIQQEPNRKFLIFPLYEWLYHTGEKKYDKEGLESKRENINESFTNRINKVKRKGKDKKAVRLERKRDNRIEKVDKTLREGTLFMRWGEPVEIYDSALTDRSVIQLQRYLESIGYLSSEVYARQKVEKRKVTVIYQITEGKPHKVDTIYYETNEDENIERLIVNKKSLRKAEIKSDVNFNEEKIEAEISRIDEVLKDNGYFDFSKQYVQANVDTAWGDHEVAIQFNILPLEKNKKHKVFKIDSVNFITDAQIQNIPTSRSNVVYNKVKYKFYKETYSKKILDQRIFFYPDSLYSKSQTEQTQRQIANLDIFKFININYDTTGGQFIANIFTSPFDKFTSSNELGINVSQGLPGPFFQFSFKNRNAFGGLEILQFDIGGGWEGVPAATDEGDVFQSQEFNSGVSISFPQFLIPFVNVTKPSSQYSNPRSILQLNYTFTNRPEYIRNNINASFAYSWENQKRTQFNFTVTDLSFIDSRIQSAEFDERLDELDSLGNNLASTFRPSYVSSISFTATFNSNNYGSFSRNASFLRLFVESGGTLLNLTGTSFIEDAGLETFKFLKFNSDFRRHIIIDRFTLFAFRANFGIAIPYGNNEILPYEKYFFAGGSNSIRAWRPRRLGPGEFTPINENGFFDDSIEQNGEILFESSVEIRRNIFGFLNGAVYLDFGNSWTLRDEASRPGAVFESGDFFEEIAIGTGFGLRFDFSFLILRLDTGIKLYDPIRPAGSRFLWNSGFYEGAFENDERVIYNIGIGYPF